MNNDADDSFFIAINGSEFSRLSRLMHGQFGIHLTEKKKTLVRGRLSKILRDRGISSFGQYLDLVEKDATGAALVELVDRISTNHTYFFRESEHFHFLRSHLLPREGHEEIRLWCAGCATGEEAYTLAMLCADWKERGFRGTVKILATDISLTALELAVRGEYTDDKVRLVPESLKGQYLEQKGPDRWVVSDRLKEMVLFKRLNLMEEQYPFRNQFHGVFCRNVMIYFDHETKMKVSRRIGTYLIPGGLFFIGHSETLGRETQGLRYVRPSVYQRTDR